MYQYVYEYLNAEWLTQFTAELIFTLLGSYFIIKGVIKGVEYRREKRRMAESNQLRDNHIQLCTNRLTSFDDHYKLEMINLSSWSLESIVPDIYLANEVSLKIQEKVRSVRPNIIGQLYLNEDSTHITEQSTLIVFDSKKVSKKISGYIYDLLAARREDLIYYFGEGNTLVFSLHYEKVEQAGNQRPRIFIFELEIIKLVANLKLNHPEELRNIIKPMRNGQQHHLNRLIVMTEQYVRYQAQKTDRTLVEAVWPYVVPKSYSQPNLKLLEDLNRHE